MGKQPCEPDADADADGHGTPPWSSAASAEAPAAEAPAAKAPAAEAPAAEAPAAEAPAAEAPAAEAPAAEAPAAEAPAAEAPAAEAPAAEAPAATTDFSRACISCSSLSLLSSRCCTLASHCARLGCDGSAPPTSSCSSRASSKSAGAAGMDGPGIAVNGTLD